MTETVSPALRWVAVVLLIAAVIVGTSAPFVVTAANKSVAASRSSEAASNRAEAAANRSEKSSNVAAVAATQAKRTLEDAIANANGGSVDRAAVNDALQSIHRIEVAICGGPCP